MFGSPGSFAVPSLTRVNPDSPRVVEIAVSPDHTWITAPDADVAWFVREAIAAAGLAFGYARQGGRVVDQIIDLGADSAARAACEALALMGIRFRWHLDQDPATAEVWQQELCEPATSAE